MPKKSPKDLPFSSTKSSFFRLKSGSNQTINLLLFLLSEKQDN